MKILIIGGTRFVGHHIAQTAINNGHEVTLFNRGRTKSELTGEVMYIKGDRNVDLEKLKGFKFDAVIDTCAYLPNQVKETAQVLKDSVKKYLLISTISTLNPKELYTDESVELKEADMSSTDITAETYGPLKVGCEEVLLDIYPEEDVTIIRPGYIVGNKDYTDRFTFWPIMMKNLDKMLIPKHTNLNYQFIDVKDLGEFVVLALEKELSGAYHLTGPKTDLLFTDFIHLCKDIMNPDCELIELDDEWFEKNQIVKPRMFPTYSDDEFSKLLFSLNTEKAQKVGLRYRPIEDTIMDAVEWFESNRESVNDLAAGISINDMKEKINQLI